VYCRPKCEQDPDDKVERDIEFAVILKIDEFTSKISDSSETFQQFQELAPIYLFIYLDFMKFLLKKLFNIQLLLHGMSKGINITKPA
jgi:hypothetical protein